MKNYKFSRKVNDRIAEGQELVSIKIDFEVSSANIDFSACQTSYQIIVVILF